MTPPTDPYGVDLALDASGDLIVTHSGSLGLVNGPYNCAQAVFLRLKTEQGDLALHPGYGSQLESREIGSKAQPAAIGAQLGSELRALITEDPRFTDAQVVTTNVPARGYGPGSVQFGVKATLVGGEQLTLTSSDPAPSDIALPTTATSADPTITLDQIDQLAYFQGNTETEIDQLQDLANQAWLTTNTILPTTT